MKKVRIVLSTIAVALALGATFAFAPSTNVAYQFIDNPSPVPDQCEQKNITCQLEETLYPCRMIVGGAVLREHSNATTSCGNPLWRTTPPPTN